MLLLERCGQFQKLGEATGATLIILLTQRSQLLLVLFPQASLLGSKLRVGSVDIAFITRRGESTMLPGDCSGGSGGFDAGVGRSV